MAQLPGVMSWTAIQHMRPIDELKISERMAMGIERGVESIEKT